MGRKGLERVRLEHLYSSDTLKSFDDLKQQYDLPHTQFWRYLQVRHALQTIFGSRLQSPKPADKLHTILKVFGRGHEAAKYYKMLMESGGDGGVSALRLIWERDLGLSYDEQDLASICNYRIMSRDMRVRLIKFKVLNRFYWTPSRLFRFDLKDAATYWKCGMDEGTLVHTLWSCPRINQYWKKIHCYIANVIKRQYVLCPKLYILGDCKVLSAFPYPLKHWIQTAIMVG